MEGRQPPWEHGWGLSHIVLGKPVWQSEDNLRCLSALFESVTLLLVAVDFRLPDS